MYADSTGLNDLSGRVIGCAFTVLNTLGAGFAAKVYEYALKIELRAAGFTVAQQRSVKVHYNDGVVGEYFPDLLVEDVLLVLRYHRDATADRDVAGQRGGLQGVAYIREHNAMRRVGAAEQRDRLLPIVGGVGCLKDTARRVEIDVEGIKTELEIEYGFDPSARRHRVVDRAGTGAQSDGIWRANEFQRGRRQTAAGTGCVAVQIDRRRGFRSAQI
jgi:hypothetical protein